ncbi:ABC transporter permease [Phyllobacterium zundukense]|uniref:ABC transmembrane type-1 domain-containing protein n=1 Tax=Phyllobacterium zundukense TaxID=1867719 RepID=A0A2N9VYI4_9HYPH|nr:ABC transporter permease subunit [Phyllobacterium zundukense]ATU95141.1 hypothetical protein BLM14_25655 [Phyllobacterium zundukense]PIO44552.1 hypothetical protein B5P45_11780 [Phyllobacterium zundukense]
MDVNLIWSSIPVLARGLQNTMQIVVSATLLGGALALAGSILTLSRQLWIRKSVQVCSSIIRGTPILVQLFFVYYGFAQYEWIRNSWFWWILKEPIPCATMVFAINHAGYLVPLWTGAFAGVNRGQWEAARSLGLSKKIAFSWIIFPQAVRLIQPAYLNEIIFLLKGSALLSAIAVADLLGVARRISSAHFAPLEMFSVVACVYAAIVLTMMGIVAYVRRNNGNE